MLCCFSNFFSTIMLPYFFMMAVAFAAAITRRGLNWDYDNDKIRGVNLGGWFVLEPYITPSLFDVFGSSVPVDEYHYCQQLGKQVCKERLETHWKTWYTEDDFKAIKQAGINAVRIPIGYWAYELLDNDPYVQGQDKYLQQALEWCRNNDLKAWIDLHGAPGSQNGFDNSGLRGQVQFQWGNNVQVTLDALNKIFNKYGGSDYEDVVIGIEALNEPLGPSLDMNKLKDFINQAYSNLRDTGSVQALVVQDAFQSNTYWNDELQTPNAWNVVIDHHHYQVFSPSQLQTSNKDRIQNACMWGWSLKEESHWNVAGEWSAALTDCARWLNGVGRGARWSGDYDNSPYIGSCDPYTEVANWPSSYRTDVRKYIEAQLDAFEVAGGWFFWNWKCEDAIEWDFKRLTAAGVFPSPVTERNYPNQCKF